MILYNATDLLRSMHNAYGISLTHETREPQRTTRRWWSRSIHRD